jgi:hypothetical protein
MITQETLCILGAGASKPYGFPKERNSGNIFVTNFVIIGSGF